MPSKRKPPSKPVSPSSSTFTATPSFPPSKKTRITTSASPTTPPDPLRQPHPFHLEAERSGIVLRSFYPPEMSNARARAYADGTLRRPIDELIAAQTETGLPRKAIDASSTGVACAVVHWFKSDLRVADNCGLALAADKAAHLGVPLIGLFVFSPQDWDAHLTAPIRVDFILRSLAFLRDELAARDIPLWIETVEKRAAVASRIMQLCGEWGARHLCANVEYEVDELRREARLVRMGAEKGIAVEVVHDTCVVPPGQLKSGSGRQYAVYSPWFRSWIAHVHENLELIEVLPPPGRNPSSARELFGNLFDCRIPDAPESKRLSLEDAKRFRALWPAGEHEAMKRLEKFCEENVSNYAKNRNFPSTAGTSNLSVHLASGTLSARTAVRYARDRNKSKKLDQGNEGVKTWISEIAWRDFYKHVLVNWPYVW